MVLKVNSHSGVNRTVLYYLRPNCHPAFSIWSVNLLKIYTTPLFFTVTHSISPRSLVTRADQIRGVNSAFVRETIPSAVKTRLACETSCTEGSIEPKGSKSSILQQGILVWDDQKICTAVRLNSDLYSTWSLATPTSYLQIVPTVFTFSLRDLNSRVYRCLPLRSLV